MKFLWLPLCILFGLGLLVGRTIRRKLSVLKDQLAAYRRGDYQAQLEIIEGFRVNESEPADYLFFRGATLFKLGRLDEAERALRRSLAMEKVPSLKVICRDELGRVLMERQHWEEAEACFRECIQEAPMRGGGHRAMAELLLRRGDARASALEFAGSAVACDRVAKAGLGKLAKEDRNTSLSESLAFLAWAEAENQGELSDVEGALKEAFALCAETTKPVVSELHFCAGHAYAAMGRTTDSSRHFHSAAETDPIGTYGRLAATFA